VETINLTKRYQADLLAVDSVTLRVQPGEIYCLVGAAGSGKTTVLHTLLGFVKATAGAARLAGMDAARDPLVARERVTYVAERASVYPRLTVRQNLEFFARLDGNGVGLARHDYYNALRKVGIADRHFERPAASVWPRGGSVALWLAIALVKNTPILLLDEPTAGLDLYSSAELQSTLLELRERGKALLVATADVMLAGRIGDRIGIMKEGRKTIELSRDELRKQPLPQLYLEYMGAPLTTARKAADG
jgi:ABC-2 type transport system ATP-binding protein